MALIAFPTTVLPEKSVMRPISTVGIGESPYTLQAQKQVFDARRWAFDLIWPVIANQIAAAELEAFIMKLNGRENTTLVPIFDRPTALGTALGTPLIDGASQTGELVDTKGWDNSQTGVLLAGDYVQIGNYAYMVVTSANSDGAGLATLDIRPALRSSPADNDSVTTALPATLCRLATNINEIEKDKNYYTNGLTLVFVEEI